LKHEKKKWQQRKYNNVVIAAIAIIRAVKEEKYPLTTKEIIETMEEMGHGRVKKRIIRAYLEGKIEKTIKNNDAEVYIERIVAELTEKEEVKEKVKRRYNEEIKDYRMMLYTGSKALIKSIPKKERGGRNPYGLAVAVIYTIARIVAKRLYKRLNPLTYCYCAKITKVGKYTLRVNYEYITEKYTETIEKITKMLKEIKAKKDKEKEQKKLWGL